MNRAIKILKLELSKPKSIRGLFGIMFIFLIFSCITDKVAEIPINFLNLLPYIILLSSFYVLGVEFQDKTDKIIFSCSYKRYEILISKLIYAVIKSLIAGLIYLIINFVINLYLGTSIVKIFSIKQISIFCLTIILYSIVITSCIFLITLLTGNGKITGVIVYILFFDITNALLGEALKSSSISKSIAFLIENSPFYVANSGLVSSYYSFTQVIFMLLLGAISLSSSFILLNKRSI